jgi:hypothetical protein
VSKRPIDQLLDLFVYAPLGLVMNLDEVVPQLVEKGHQQVNMARMFGQFAVETGTKEARKRVEQLADRGSSRPATPARAAASPAVKAEPVEPEEAGASEELAVVPAESELSIPGYDSLSASQVVPRLDGLSADERDAVRRYEAAHRGRKTILSKLAQLS